MKRVSAVIIGLACCALLVSCVMTQGGISGTHPPRVPRTVETGYEFASVPGGTAVAGREYRYEPAAGVSRPEECRYELAQGPAGMSISGGKTLRWLPGNADRGDHEIIVRAVTPGGIELTQRFILTVKLPTEWRQASMGGGGWIPDVKFSPVLEDVMYASCDVAGFFRSEDGGLTWRNLNEGFTDYYLHCLACHPTDVDILYAGTLSGVFKSVDGGESWVLKRNGFPEPEDFSYTAPIGSLAVDEMNPEIVYAGIGHSRHGTYGMGTMYKSTDGAESWTAYTEGFDPEVLVKSLVIHPLNRDTIYAGTSRGFYLSTDGGLSWTESSEGLPHGNIFEIEVHPEDGDILYLTLETDFRAAVWMGGVYKSVDGGRTWTEKNWGLKKEIMGNNHPFRVSNYWPIAIDPEDPDVLYVGDVSWISIGIYKSINGGESWSLVLDRFDPNSVEHGWINHNSPFPKNLAIDPFDRNHLFFGNGGHVMETRDGGVTWHPVYTRRMGDGRWAGTGIETACLWDIEIDPADSDRVYCAYWDLCVMWTEDGGESFTQTRVDTEKYGDFSATALALDPDNTHIVYAGTNNNTDEEGRIFRSDDGGLGWKLVGSPKSGLPPGHVREILIDPSPPAGSRTIYALSRFNGVYKSVDDGGTWSASNNGLPKINLNAWGLEMDPKNPRTLYLSIHHNDDHPGGMYRSENGGESWVEVPAYEYLRYIYDIEVDPSDSNVLYAGTRFDWDNELERAFDGGVYKSTDGGRTWSLKSAGWPEDKRVAVSDIIIDPRDTDVVYASTFDHPYHDHYAAPGIFVSVDGGESWRTLNEGLPMLCIETLELDPARDILYAGTQGSSLFMRKLGDLRELKKGE